MTDNSKTGWFSWLQDIDYTIINLYRRTIDLISFLITHTADKGLM